MTHPDKFLRCLCYALLSLPAPLLAATPPAPHMLELPIAQGDTLIGIANRLLARPNQWPRLQTLNRIANPRQLQPGSTLRIPLSMLRGEPVPARLESVLGEVSGTNGPLAAGSLLKAGEILRTGAHSYAVLVLPDDSRIIVQADSEAHIEQLLRLPLDGNQQSRVKISKGRLETRVQPQRGPAARYEITTPTAVIGVRGTEFRAAFDGSASRVEVTAGLVTTNQATAVAAGQGAIVDAQGARTEALLPAPLTAAIPALFERPLLRLPLPDTLGAGSHRVIVAAAADFDLPVANQLVTGREARIAGLPDGDYRLRLRAISASGLEGQHSEIAFRLKARPEPPFISDRSSGGKFEGAQREFRWTAQTDAARYRIQVSAASDPAFSQPVFAADDLGKTTLSVPLPPGDYLWRLASVRADGDRGPWGDAAAFTLKALQGPPAAPEMDEKTARFAWPGEPGQRFEFEMAQDIAFTRLLSQHQTSEASLSLPKPQAPGEYFIRVRATDADGFVGSWSTPQSFRIEEAQPWWLLAFPVLLMLL